MALDLRCRSSTAWTFPKETDPGGPWSTPQRPLTAGFEESEFESGVTFQMVAPQQKKGF
jgi:hypothetical protein